MPRTTDRGGRVERLKEFSNRIWQKDLPIMNDIVSMKKNAKGNERVGWIIIVGSILIVLVAFALGN